MARRGTPVLLDKRGKPLMFGDYEATKENRFRKPFGNLISTRPRPEDEMLSQGDRQKIIAWIRQAFRNNLVVRGILWRYALAIGSPSIHSQSSDPVFNDLKERYLERQMRNMRYGVPLPMRMFEPLVALEEIITGECFLVFTAAGNVQVIPSELCGSPPNAPENERQGIQFDDTGRPIAYRFGKRIKESYGSRVSFDDKDASIIEARYVKHVGQPLREEEIRISPPLAPAIAALVDLADITRAKIMQIKVQSAFALFVKKNIDPEVLAMMFNEQNESLGIGEQILARSDYQTIQSGSIMYGEEGEEVQTISPIANAADYTEFERNRLHHICSCIGIPPEEAILGYSKSNYSSSRADKNRWVQVIENVRQNHIEQYIDDWQTWQCERAKLFDLLPSAPAGEQRDVYYGWPQIPTIDPTKDVAAATARIASGLSSRGEEIGKTGRFVDVVDKQIVAEAKLRAQAIKDAVGDTTPLTAAELQAQIPNGQQAAAVLQALTGLTNETNSNNADGNSRTNDE